MSLAVAPNIERISHLPVRQIVADIRRDFKARRKDEHGNHLLVQLLNYASDVEQQIADQQRRIAELEALSLTDELTGLPNLRAFNDFLIQTLARARRHNEEGVLGYFDMNGFKTINDRFGHDAGDAALKHVAAILKSSIRISDQAARLHGDEFAVVLVHSDHYQGAKRMQQIATQIMETKFHFNGDIILLGVSVGIVTFSGTENADALLKKADTEMYQAKEGKTITRPGAAPRQASGKGCVILLSG